MTRKTKEERELKTAYAIKYIREDIVDSSHRWTKQLSDTNTSKETFDTNLNSRKRQFTRNVFYNKVNFPKDKKGYRVNSTDGLHVNKMVADHVLPPQMLGEFFLDKYRGYYTKKDESILNNLPKWIELMSRCVLVPKKLKGKSVNGLLSYHSCNHKNSINNPKNYKPILISQKYKYLNENDDGVSNSHIFKGNLTIMKNGKEATAEELAWLLESPEGFEDWQVEKYGVTKL